MDRVAFVAFCWFVFWTGAGASWPLSGDSRTITVAGFIFALVSMFAWPWILPERLNRWMSE